jgi:hypothetical protein
VPPKFLNACSKAGNITSGVLFFNKNTVISLVNASITISPILNSSSSEPKK